MPANSFSNSQKLFKYPVWTQGGNCSRGLVARALSFGAGRGIEPWEKIFSRADKICQLTPGKSRN